MLKLIASAIVALSVIPAHSQEYTAIRKFHEVTRDRSTEDLIQMYWQANEDCQDDWSGEINQFCLLRTNLVRVLERRNMCMSSSLQNSGTWVPCRVRSR